MIEAIQQIYSSETYKKLEKEETKLWHWGPVDLYNEMVEEYNSAIPQPNQGEYQE